MISRRGHHRVPGQAGGRQIGIRDPGEVHRLHLDGSAGGGVCLAGAGGLPLIIPALTAAQGGQCQHHGQGEGAQSFQIHHKASSSFPIAGHGPAGPVLSYHSTNRAVGQEDTSPATVRFGAAPF